MNGPALLAGPDLALGAEGYAAHAARLGPLPPIDASFVDELDRAGLRGRGGAAFPVSTKWRSVAAHQRAGPVVLANGAEGEPLSRKDRVLMETRPHLVLDGAAIAAQALGALRIVHYIGADHAAALRAMRRAIAERPDWERRLTQVASAPVRYVAGEESAAVHFVDDGVAVPTTVPPRPYERGVGGRPTLVQNVETLAHVALVARLGAARFRSLGRDGAAGTALVTVSGAVPAITVRELAQGNTIADAVNAAGGLTGDTHAVLIGGYFGTWLPAPEAWSLRLDAAALQAQGRALGCGVIGVLPAAQCGVTAAARVMSYLAHESSRQCGPCTFGLRAIAAATGRLASGAREHDDLERVRRWSGLLAGRGACRHPDGAAVFLQSALRVFAAEFEVHHTRRRCSVAARGEAAA